MSVGDLQTAARSGSVHRRQRRARRRPAVPARRRPLRRRHLAPRHAPCRVRAQHGRPCPDHRDRHERRARAARRLRRLHGRRTSRPPASSQSCRSRSCPTWATTRAKRCRPRRCVRRRGGRRRRRTLTDVAEDACELIDVDFERLPAVLDPERAIEAGAPILHDDLGSNLIATMGDSHGDPERAFARGRARLPQALRARTRRGDADRVPRRHRGVRPGAGPVHDLLLHPDPRI